MYLNLQEAHDEIARLKSKVGEITMDNELLYAKIAALEGKRPLAHRRSRRCARHSRPPWLAVMAWRASPACGRSRAPASIAPQGDAAEHDRPSPWSGRRRLGRGIGRAYPPANSRLPPSRRGLPQVMGAVALCWRSHEPPSCATGNARERLARAASRRTHRGQAARWDDHHRQDQ